MSLRLDRDPASGAHVPSAGTGKTRTESQNLTLRVFFSLSELKKKTTFEWLSCPCHKSASTPKSNLAVEFLNSSSGNELGEHNKITIKFVYKTVLSTCWIGQRSLQSPDFSAVECVW